ncbi:MAG TPA: carboxypeptidase-like regulatory domain-containing protein, partial [Chitinophagaceae bacterium]|nr:carboxypeptidase-like regulatory domain-containing protein [Chitinophagaceae bacterium]
MEYFTRVIFEQSFKLQNQIDRCWHSFILIIGITSIVLTIKPISSSAKPVNGLSNSHTKSIYFFQKTVKGKVTDSLTGQSLTGVTIKVKDENIGTVTDAKGNFSL